MPPSPLPLTLIVATTPSLGIGLRGSLPWPPLKADMAFFRHATSHVPNTGGTLDCNAVGEPNMKTVARNAVIMGRKTWDSIPSKFRPLKGRINVIITRKPLNTASGTPETAAFVESEDIIVVNSLDEAAERLRQCQTARTFVIGGAEIYRLALDSAAQKSSSSYTSSERVEGLESPPKSASGTFVERILWTKIACEYECDTQFPISLNDEIGDDKTWKRRDDRAFEAWVNKSGIAGPKSEGVIGFEMIMLESDQNE